ncbi:MAG: WD40/YVTN/BNR-like repeat-containing protein, partial [bacterium]
MSSEPGFSKLVRREPYNFLFTFLILIVVWVKTTGCSHELPLPPPIDASIPGDGIWKPIGPFGVDVTALAVAPAEPNLLFTATTMGDIYRSDNAGTSWERVATLGTTVRTLNFHPTDPRIVYAGADLFGVQKTNDGGETWTATGTGLEFDPFVYALAVHPQDHNVIYAGTFKSIGTGGVYKSTNGGSNWQASR